MHSNPQSKQKHPEEDITNSLLLSAKSKLLFKESPLKEKNLNPVDLTLDQTHQRSKEGVFVEQVNFLSKKIERSSLTERAEDSEEDVFLHELNESIQTEISLTPINEPIDRSKYNIVQKTDDYIKITLVESNIDLKTVPNEYYIGEKGLSCSQKTYGRDYVSFGRQQIDEQCRRPNDIMLFPTDPSISRSHLKVFYRKLFCDVKEYKAKERLVLQLNIPAEFIENILQFLKPKMTVKIEDNETIYGTYVKVKPFNYQSIVINLFLTLDSLKSIDKCDRPSLDLDNPVIDYLHSLSSVLPNIRCKVQMMSSCLKHAMYEKLHTELLQMNSKHLPEQFLDSFSSEVKPLNVLLEENNLILKESMVFLTSSWNGLVVRFVCPLTEMLKRFRMNYQSIDRAFTMIKVFSDFQVFAEQKYDHESSLYKLILHSNVLIVEGNVTPISPNLDYLKEYHSLLCIETFGDPCGIMNRQTSLLFIQKKDNSFSYAKNNAFSFNLTKGFLLGRHMKRSYLINTESDIMIYYSPINSGTWMISDLTLFLNPSLCELPDYFGLYLCSSKDKFYQNRYSRTPHEIGQDDRVRLSESVLKFDFSIK